MGQPDNFPQLGSSGIVDAFLRQITVRDNERLSWPPVDSGEVILSHCIVIARDAARMMFSLFRSLSLSLSRSRSRSRSFSRSPTRVILRSLSRSRCSRSTRVSFSLLFTFPKLTCQRSKVHPNTSEPINTPRSWSTRIPKQTKQASPTSIRFDPVGLLSLGLSDLLVDDRSPIVPYRSTSLVNRAQ